MTPTTLLKLITDLTDALERQGIKKLVLLNGHGGNELKPLSRELPSSHECFYLRMRLVQGGSRFVSDDF